MEDPPGTLSVPFFDIAVRIERYMAAPRVPNVGADFAVC